MFGLAKSFCFALVTLNGAIRPANVARGLCGGTSGLHQAISRKTSPEERLSATFATIKDQPRNCRNLAFYDA